MNLVKMRPFKIAPGPGKSGEDPGDALAVRGGNTAVCMEGNTNMGKEGNISVCKEGKTIVCKEGKNNCVY